MIPIADPILQFLEVRPLNPLVVTSHGIGSTSREAAAIEGLDQDEKTPAQLHVAMTWAQRLKRVFNIDVETCRVCGAAAKIIACIEDPAVIRKIPGVLGMQNVLNDVSMAVGVMEMALYSSYTLLLFIAFLHYFIFTN